MSTHSAMHKHYGMPLSEWVSRVPNELAVDAVGLWQIASVLEREFGLTGAELEAQVRECVSRVVGHGALPVQGGPDRTWIVREDLAYPQDAAVEQVVQYWKGLGREPTVSDVWFVLPRFLRGVDALYLDSTGSQRGAEGSD